MLIHNKDDIEFVTEFPCLLGHPVFPVCYLEDEASVNILNYVTINLVISSKHPKLS